MTAPKRRRRRVPPADRIHARIDREHAASWWAFEQSGRQVAIEACPAIRELLEAAQAAARLGHRFSRRIFTFRGRRYPVVLTSFGRVIVRHPETGRDIGATAFFSGW